MCETPKDEEVEESKRSKDLPRSYYYDDAHGYQDFDPENETDDDVEDELT